MENLDFIKEIERLKKEKNAVILAHNYQPDEIQGIADFIGDSLELAKKVINVKADIIVFCGVMFMAEMAYVLNPEKKVLLPRADAGCPMADTITASDVDELREKYPDHTFIGYVNTNSDVKAKIDICCTSANAHIIAKNIPNDKIVYLPDKNLGNYLQKQLPEKEIVLWPGCCRVHDKITLEEVKQSKENHPEAELIVHPECRPEVVEFADHVLSTGGMVKYVKNSDTKEFLVGTEQGMINRLRREAPDKVYYPVSKSFTCINMKKIRIQDVYESLKDGKYSITVDEEDRIAAKRTLDEMLKYL